MCNIHKLKVLKTAFEGGMGIGLSLCNKIVDNHAGTISRKSQEGQGATIVIVLPLSQANR